MNKRYIVTMVTFLLLMLPITACAEYNTITVWPDISFQMAMEKCWEEFSAVCGISTDRIANMEYKWKGTPRYLLVPSNEPYYTQSDANWYFSIEYTTEDDKIYHFTFRKPMLDMDKNNEFGFLADISGRKSDPLRIALEEDYQKNYAGMDEETARLESEKGPYFLWTFDEKAAFYQRWNMEPYHHDDYVSGIFLHEQWVLPGQSDLQYSEASVIAEKIVKEKYHFTDEIMKALYIDARFYKWSDDDGDPQWKIIYWMYADCGGVLFWDPVCIVTISRDGGEQWCSLY